MPVDTRPIPSGLTASLHWWAARRSPIQVNLHPRWPQAKARRGEDPVALHPVAQARAGHHVEDPGLLERELGEVDLQAGRYHPGPGLIQGVVPGGGAQISGHAVTEPPVGAHSRPFLGRSNSRPAA